jgi:hypothetical protein
MTRQKMSKRIQHHTDLTWTNGIHSTNDALLSRRPPRYSRSTPDIPACSLLEKSLVHVPCHTRRNAIRAQQPIFLQPYGLLGKKYPYHPSLFDMRRERQACHRSVTTRQCPTVQAALISRTDSTASGVRNGSSRQGKYALHDSCGRPERTTFVDQVPLIPVQMCFRLVLNTGDMPVIIRGWLTNSARAGT